MTITYALVGSVAVVTLDDGKANAFGHDTLDELDTILAKARAEAGAVVIAGRPGMFSAGFDLATMRADVDSMRGLLAHGGRFTMGLWLYPRPVVMAVTGHAMAAGAVMLLAADVRIGAEGTFKIAMNEVPLGLPVPAFAVELARYKLPPAKLDLVTLGSTFDPAGALEVGFFDRVAAPEQVVAEAVAEATKLAELPAVAVAGTKQRLRGALAQRILAGLDTDMASLDSPWTS
jgi:enoyl-CoA hydratase